MRIYDTHVYTIFVSETVMPCTAALKCSRPLLRANIHDLHQSIVTGNSNEAIEILRSGAVDLNVTVCGATMLSLALYKQADVIFETLLLQQQLPKRRLDINKLSKDDKHRLEPPLVTACRLGNVTAVRLLIKHGADLEAVDDFLHTALWMSVRQRNKYLVTLLITHGACVSPSPLYTHSPLYFSIKYSSKRAELAALLIYNGASIRIHKAKTSILYCSILEGNINIAELLIEAGYNVSADEKIRENLQNGMLTRNKILVKWLKYEQTNAPSLQKQCRATVRRVVANCAQGKLFLQRLVLLPLPRCMIRYLSLHDNNGSLT